MLGRIPKPMTWKVWEFGTSVGMRDLAALHGYLFSHAGKTWRSNQHTALTLSAAGVQDGDLVEFAGDFEPLAGDEPAVQPRAADSVSDGEAGGSRASTANGRDASAKDSPKEGARPGSRGVGTRQGTKKDAGATDSPKEGTRPVRTPEGSRGVRTPESTKKDASVKDSAKEGARAVTTPEGSRGVRTPDGTKKDTIATSESTPAADGAVPSAPAAPAPAAKAQIRVTLIDHKKRQRECVGRASLETCVWDFGVSVGMDHLATLHGYLFTYAGQTWLSNGPNKHQSLTLAAAGVQDGETVTFAGDFESVAACLPVSSQKSNVLCRGSQGRSQIILLLLVISAASRGLFECDSGRQRREPPEIWKSFRPDLRVALRGALGPKDAGGPARARMRLHLPERRRSHLEEQTVSQPHACSDRR